MWKKNQRITVFIVTWGFIDFFLNYRDIEKIEFYFYGLVPVLCNYKKKKKNVRTSRTTGGSLL